MYNKIRVNIIVKLITVRCSCVKDKLTLTFINNSTSMHINYDTLVNKLQKLNKLKCMICNTQMVNPYKRWRRGGGGFFKFVHVSHAGPEEKKDTV